MCGEYFKDYLRKQSTWNSMWTKMNSYKIRNSRIWFFLVTRPWQNIPIFTKLFVSALVYNSIPDWICFSLFVPCMTVKQPVRGLEASKKNPKIIPGCKSKPTNQKTWGKKYLFFLPVLFPSLGQCIIQSKRNRHTMAAHLGLT